MKPRLKLLSNWGVKSKRQVPEEVRYRDAVYEGAAFCRLVASAAADAGAFGEFVRELNGCFAIVLQRDGSLCAATDRLRSFPLCRTRFRDAWLVTDDLLRAMEDTGMQPEIDSGAMEQFLLSGFVIGQRTVFRDIFAVQAAEIVRLRDAETESERYFLYDPKMNVTPDPAEGVRTADTQPCFWISTSPAYCSSRRVLTAFCRPQWSSSTTSLMG